MNWKRPLLGASFVLFVLLAALPSDLFSHAHIAFFILATFTSILGCLQVRTLKWNLAFVLLFLLAAYNYAVEKGYHFGSDDSFYYAYVSSIVIDHDLDLTNQYQLSGLPPEFLTVKTPAGNVQNVFPIGASLLWLPFFLIGHAVAWILSLAGHSVAMNGYSEVYLNAVILGTIAYAFAGLFFCYRFLTFYFSRLIACLSSVAIWWTTPLYVYSTRVFLVSETVSMFAVSLLVYLSKLFEDELSAKRVFLLGLVGGMATIVRFHDAFFLIIPVTLILRNQSFKRLCFLMAGVLLAFLPQMIVWKVLFGSWIVNVPGEFLTSWKSPFVLETLFSARKGLFPWSPITLLASASLFLLIRKDTKWGWLLLSLLLSSIYVNASTWGWWADTAFGARRFTNCTILFAAGLAAFHHEMAQRLKTKGHLIVFLIIALLANMNFFLTRAYRRGRLEYEHANRFSDVLRGGIFPIYNLLVYPIEFPVQFYYWVKYGITMYQAENEFFIGEDVLFFQKKHGDLVMGSQNPLFGKGWQQSGAVRVTTGQESTLNLPMFFKYDMDVLVSVQLRPLRSDRDVWIEFYLNDLFLASRKVPPEGRKISLRLSNKAYLRQVNLIRLHVYRKKHPEGSVPPVELELLQFEVPP